MRPPLRLASLSLRPTRPRRTFSTSPALLAKNRIYNNIRRPDELHTLLLLSASSHVPLVTLWSASWCSACAAVRPVLKELLESEGVGEAAGGLGFAEVELDSVEIGALGVEYMINSMPTLLAFSRGEAQMETKLVRPEVMKDRAKLREWLEEEARRGG
ncbi:uncharacterized protein BDZ99DRAFT_419312, partial [Mytilinidion resinicola]